MRRFTRRPFLSLAIVLVLALGIAAATTIFTIVNGFLLTPLPYPDPDQLVAIWETPHKSEVRNLVSYPNFLDWGRESRTFEAMGAFRYVTPPLRTGADPAIVRGAIVSAGYFSVLKISPFVGRHFTAEECEPGGPKAIVLSYDLWRQLGASLEILNTPVTVEGRSHTVVGVMPRDLRVLKGIEEPRFWIPVDPSNESRANHRWFVLARLRSGATIEQARAEMQGVSERLSRLYPETNAGQTILVDPDTHEEYFVNRTIRLPALILTFAAGFLLLVVCVNVTALLGAATVSRAKEFGIRFSLGCGRLRLSRQILTECFLLALAGGALAVLISSWSIHLIGSSLAARAFDPGVLRIDGTVVTFVFLTSLMVAVAFGLFPAIKAGRVSVIQNLKSSTTGSGSGFSHHRSLGSMVAIEVALSLVLLINAGLLSKSFLRLTGTDPGFQTEQVVTTSTFLSEEAYSDPERQVLFIGRFLTSVSRLPGVEKVGMAGRLPLCGPFGSAGLQTGSGALSPGNEPSEYYEVCSPDYFSALGVRLHAGRFFNDTDRPSSPKAVIVNQALCRKHWPGEEAVGQQVKVFNEWRTVVGVVGDVSQEGQGLSPRPEIFLPYSQHPSRSAFIVIKTSREATGLENLIRDELRRIDPGQPLAPLKTMQEVIADRLMPQRLTLVLMAVFAAIALTLTLAGVYGVVDNAVQSRKRELGIRLALGASPSGLLLGTLLKSALPVVIGVLGGLTLAFGTTRFLSSLFFGVSARDLVVFSLVPALICVVALAAAYLPIRRTLKVEPSSVLRWD